MTISRAVGNAYAMKKNPDATPSVCRTRTPLFESTRDTWIHTMLPMAGGLDAGRRQCRTTFNQLCNNERNLIWALLRWLGVVRVQMWARLTRRSIRAPISEGVCVMRWQLYSNIPWHVSLTMIPCAGKRASKSGSSASASSHCS